MKKSLNDIDIPKIIQEAQDRLTTESVSVGMYLVVETLLFIIQGLLLRFGANSSNSSVPPSRDPNRKKKKSVKNLESEWVAKGAIRVQPFNK